MIEGDLETLEDVRPRPGDLEFVSRAPGDDLATEGDELLQRLLEADDAGLAIDQRQHVDGEGRLQGRVLVERVEQLLRLGLALQQNDDPHPLAVRLVAQFGDAGEPLAVDQGGDLLDQGRLIHLVGQLGNDDLARPALGRVCQGGLGADDDAAATGGEGALDAVLAEDDAAGGKVRPFDEVGEVVDIGARIINQVGEGVAKLAEVVRRDVGGHADGDSRAAVQEQIGHAGRHHQRLGQAFVEVGAEIDRILVDVNQHLAGDLGEAGFSVAHRRRGIGVNTAEVTLAVDQRRPHREVLSHPHQGVVDRSVAVRVELAEDLADDTSALLVGTVVRHPHLVHRIEDAAMYRLQPITHVRQSAGNDDSHRIGNVGTPHLIFDAYRADITDYHYVSCSYSSSSLSLLR